MLRTIGKDKIKERPEDDVAADEESLESNHSSRWYQALEKFSCTHYGQLMMKGLDRILNVVEDTAKWSVPQDHNDTKLNRPLPWIFFLSLILFLRLVRLCLSVGNFIMEYQPVTALSVVVYLQTLRRRLRALRHHGRREILNREVDNCVTERPSQDVRNNRAFTEVFSKQQYRKAPATLVEDKEVEQKPNRASKKSLEDLDDDNVNELSPSEMFYKCGYFEIDSENDSDYAPCELDDSFTSVLTVSMNTSDEGRHLNKSSATQFHMSDISVMEEEEQQIKEDVKDEETKCHSKADSLSRDHLENHPNIDSSNKEIQTPKGNDEVDAEETKPAPEVIIGIAPESVMHTPQEHVVVIQSDDTTVKPTPGLITAAPNNEPLNETDNSQQKAHRTITTQTAIELDWTITIKTEIIHKKYSPKLEKVKRSVDLTPASSTEDIFHSPMGSFQDIHSIFHPAPIVKAGSVEALRSTLPASVEQSEASSNETPDIAATGSQKKNHTNHSKNYHYYNGKNRSKARRS